MNTPLPLARLLGILESSLAMYISDSGIWSYPGDESLKLALADLVADQRSLIERAGVILEERDLPIPGVVYPLAFTAWHDLDLGYLLPRVIAGLRSQLPQVREIAASSDPAVADLAREAESTTARHLGILEELQVRLRAGLSGRPAGPAQASGPTGGS